jgi:hypothetical protein
MTHLDEHGRPEPPLAGDETATLLGFLDYQRATLAWKCAGLDAAGLGATLAASSMTLGGLLKHLAYVEDWWCSWWLHGRVSDLRLVDLPELEHVRGAEPVLDNRLHHALLRRRGLGARQDSSHGVDLDAPGGLYLMVDPS